MPPPTGNAIRAGTVEELFAAVARVQPGETILVEEGHYWMPRYLEIRTDRVTLRGASGRRERVVLDGAQSRDGELLGVRGCAEVTLADLTLQNIKWNGIKLNSDSNVQRIAIYNCVLHNIWQRAVKGVRVPRDQLEAMRPRDCRVQFCLFYNDRPKRFDDDPADTPQNFDGNYIGGIDVMFPSRWIISDNVFLGIQGRTRQARGAVFLWHDAQDCVVERNVIIDCDTGIALGNSYRPAGIPVHATGLVARNNFIARAPESGIVTAWTQDCQLLHNTIHHPDNRLGRLIRVVHDNPGLVVANNLLSGPPIRLETDSALSLNGNVTTNLTRAFVDAAAGNLRLNARVPGVADTAQRLANVPTDIDGQTRKALADAGAHEFDPAPVAEPKPWVAAMRRVHAQFKGQRGTFAHFGDSITVSRAFWSSLPYSRQQAPPELEQAFAVVKERMRPACWEWKGPAYGNEGRMTIRWAAENVEAWLARLEPEVALIMFGSNDVNDLSLAEYEAKTRQVVQQCLAAGTVVILSTPPPRHSFATQTAAFAEAVRRVARDLHLPLTDYHAEILKRRPDDWDGALAKFGAFDGYEVPTLISRDGVHPSNPKAFQGHYSPEALRSNGFSLRNYLVLLRYAGVISEVLGGGR